MELLESTAKVSACSQAMIYNKYRGTGETQMRGAHLAAYFGLLKSMSVLLERRHDVDSRDRFGRTPLSYAAGNGHEAIVKLLLDRNAAVDSLDIISRTPLPYAAENGHEAIVKLLLDRNAAVDSQDEDGRTPLSYAAGNSHEATVKLLQLAQSSQFSF